MNLTTLFGRMWLFTTLLVVAAAALCVRLGFWQLDRLSQRRAFIARVEYMQALPAARLPSSEDLRSQEYRRAIAAGLYDLERQVALRNRAYQGQYGYDLLTPLLIALPDASGRQVAVLVDRGWIPAAGNERPENWRRYDVMGPVEVHGVIRAGQQSVGRSGIVEGTSLPADQGSDFFVFIDPELIGQHLPYPLLDFYIQAEAGEDGDSAPLAMAPHLELNNGPHLGYALQWFGFSGVLIVGYPLFVRRREERQP